jgi:colanic acid/amylovoran biosynthesis glycosyltransferase
VELLLVTSRWPSGEVTEFLDDEIHHLAQAFNPVVVAPMRPKGPIPGPLPRNVRVDLSLAESLDPSGSTWGRNSRRATALVRALRPNPAGFGVTGRDFVRDALSRHWLQFSLLARADVTSVARWAARRPPPDIGYTFWLGAETAGLRAAWPSVALVSRAHRSELYAEAHGWRSIPFQAAAVRSADLVAAVSEDGRRYLAGRYPEAADRMELRRLGVQDLGVPDARDPEEVLRVLSASSIIPVKRVDLILEVAQAVARTGMRVEWTHLGDGPGRASVENAAARAPASLVAKLAGHVPLSEVHRELRSGRYDVFVNLSVSEGAPVSLMEAQCVGLPVVATAVGGTGEVVPADLNELVEPDAPVAQLRDAVLRAARRDRREAALRRKRWRERYWADANYAAWASELLRLSESRR